MARTKQDAAASTVEKKKKKRRSKSGSKALRDIREAQKSTHLLMPKAPFFRLVRELLREIQCSREMRFRRASIAVLQEATEAHGIRLFADSNRLAIHAGRQTIYPKDTVLAKKIRSNDTNA